ncbi:hypothetical protein [Acetobacter lambici]|uniref:hypothetical protein n=1 Tax=Acetobacter lambici TaxID=1332824 RepID=UPI0020A5E26D|nr:hypothetical protein [Acetobacter lambici]MCP1243048.1 hypothetical protein [Acetobacter lambici]
MGGNEAKVTIGVIPIFPRKGLDLYWHDVGKGVLLWLVTNTNSMFLNPAARLSMALTIQVHPRLFLAFTVA